MTVYALAVIDTNTEVYYLQSPGALFDDEGPWKQDNSYTVVHIHTQVPDMTGFRQTSYYKDGAWKSREGPPADYYFWKDEKWNLDETEFWLQVRRDRDFRLLQSDWTQLPDCKLDISKQGEWTEYRQILRNVPGNNSGATMLDQIVWPDKPA